MGVDKICSCFGHKKIKISKELEEKLKSLYIDLIENKGFRFFYFGGYGMFDELCHKILLELKKYFDLKLFYVRPYYENLSQKYLNL